MLQVTRHFNKIGIVDWKIFLLCQKFLHGGDRETIWLNREIPWYALYAKI